DPKVLLMDEPFGALDAQTRETMQQELMRLHERTGKTILFVTHDLDEAVLVADRIAVMRQGRIQEIMDVPLPRPRGDLGRARGARKSADARYRVGRPPPADAPTVLGAGERGRRPRPIPARRARASAAPTASGLGHHDDLGRRPARHMGALRALHQSGFRLIS